MKSNIYKGFILFEVIFSLVLSNVVFIGLSVVSLLTLMPVLLVSTFIFIRRAYYYKEYQGILFRFFYSIKGRVLRSFTVLYPLIIFLAILVSSVLYFNQIMYDYFNEYFISVVILLQFLVIYEIVGIILLSALYIAVDTKRDILEIYKASFLLFNANPFRGLLSMISLIAMVMFILEISAFGYFIFIPVSLSAFYIVFMNVFEKRKII